MASDRTLFLHVGDHKTGSSFVQSCFALSQQELARAGVYYPPARNLKEAAAGRMSFGNAEPLLSIISDNANRIDRLPLTPPGLPAVLYSGEILMVTLVRGRSLGRLVAAARDAGFVRVRILLFIRDPIGHYASLWQQTVKKGGNIGSIDGDAVTFSRPRMASRFLDECASFSEVELCVRNYSVVRADLRGTVAAWLGLEAENLRLPPVKTVNRSLSRAELVLQLGLNAVLGRNLTLADLLCNRLPEIAADYIRPSLATQQMIWSSMEPHMARVNARVEPAHCYRSDVDTAEPVAASVLSMTADQLDLIGRTLGGEIARLRILLEGDLTLLDRYLATGPDRRVARDLLANLLNRLEGSGEQEKAGKVRDRLASFGGAANA
jgi:hypothetical protein